MDMVVHTIKTAGHPQKGAVGYAYDNAADFVEDLANGKFDESHKATFIGFDVQDEQLKSEFWDCECWAYVEYSDKDRFWCSIFVEVNHDTSD